MARCGNVTTCGQTLKKLREKENLSLEMYMNWEQNNQDRGERKQSRGRKQHVEHGSKGHFYEQLLEDLQKTDGKHARSLTMVP